jgi:hypothetical protein
MVGLVVLLTIPLCLLLRPAVAIAPLDRPTAS